MSGFVSRPFANQHYCCPLTLLHTITIAIVPTITATITAPNIATAVLTATTIVTAIVITTTVATTTMSQFPVMAVHHRTPDWTARGVRAFLNDMTQTFVAGRNDPSHRHNSLLADGVRRGNCLRHTRQLVRDLLVLLGHTMADEFDVWCTEKEHYDVGARTQLQNERDHARDRWIECPLFTPNDSSSFRHRWRSSRSPVSVNVQATGRVSIGMQVLLIPREPHDVAALERGARFVLISAVWSLAADHWQCGTPLGMALLNTSFSRLLIADGVLFVEVAGTVEPHDIDVHDLAHTRALAHDYMSHGEVDRDEFTLFWTAFVKAYDIAAVWALQDRREWEKRDRDLERQGQAKQVNGDGGGADSSNSSDSGGDDSDEDGDEDEDEDDGSDSDESTFSDYTFDYNDTPYDHEPQLLDSLARYFPHVRIIPPPEMTRLIDRHPPTEPQDGKM